MKKTLRYLGLSLAIFLLSGCGEPTLDTTSEEALKASMKEVVSQLPEDEKKQFVKSIMGLYMMTAFSGMGNKQTAEEAKVTLNEKLNGKTAEEVALLVNEIKQKMNKKKD